MPTDTVISINGVGKRYRLGELEVHRSIREAIPATARRLLWRSARRPRAERASTEFWALRDISLDVSRGEVLGIIGHNGAGKSTLLKILSRITEPTAGFARIKGRVSSLLEVGTGFHPELTGRENIFLNGSILGMTRHEIKRKFEEIVAFSGVEKFLDTPVKRYSSGMTVRLAFAVAAHLEPEVLIIDEVLAVGDAEFQSKCLGKMEDVASSGRTVLFVSHNMAAVEALCTQAVLLSHGRIDRYGSVSEVLETYLARSTPSLSDVDLSNHPGRPRKYSPLLRRIRLLDADGLPLSAIQAGGCATFELTLESHEPLPSVRLFLEVEGPRGERLFTMANHTQLGSTFKVDGRFCVQAQLVNCRLAPGRYGLRCRVKSLEASVDEIQEGLFFDVLATDVYGTGRLPLVKHGPILPEVNWICSTP